MGVERQHLLKKVKGLGICIRVELAPGDLWLVRQGLQVTSSLLVDNAVQGRWACLRASRLRCNQRSRYQLT